MSQIIGATPQDADTVSQWLFLEIFLGHGALGSIVVAARVFSEFHARHSWPIAQGQLTAATVKSYSGPSSGDHVNHYYVEYKVRFAVPVEGCLTGAILANQPEPLPCWGIVRTRSTNSQVIADSWLERHQANSSVGVLHDLKWPGEPASLVCPLKRNCRDICLDDRFPSVPDYYTAQTRIPKLSSRKL
jgi:hypothetical protein